MSCTQADQVISLSVVRDDAAGLARLVVQDAGPGMARAELAHVFDRFVTGRPGPAGQPGPDRGRRRGTGLGLALVAVIARGHGGQVHADSAPGAGARFEIVLPILAAAQAGPARAGAAPAAQCRAHLHPARERQRRWA